VHSLYISSYLLLYFHFYCRTRTMSRRCANKASSPPHAAWLVGPHTGALSISHFIILNLPSSSPLPIFSFPILGVVCRAPPPYLCPPFKLRAGEPHYNHFVSPYPLPLLLPFPPLPPNSSRREFSHTASSSHYHFTPSCSTSPHSIGKKYCCLTPFAFTLSHISIPSPSSLFPLD